MEGGIKNSGINSKLKLEVSYPLLTAIYYIPRVYSLGSLKRGEKDILVATDVAGRGIDIRYTLQWCL